MGDWLGELLSSGLAKVTLPLSARRSSVVAVALLLAACTNDSYLGISLAEGVAPPEVEKLAVLARAGDKHAQLELGIRFEEGRGVARDPAKARNLYRLAAADSGGPVWVYAPPVREGEAGRVLRMGAGPRQAGLEEARRRLQALETGQAK